MTTLKEKIEQTYGNILTDGDIDWFMDEIAAYTKRVIGSDERWELNDGTARSITERNELRKEQTNRAKEEGVEL